MAKITGYEPGEFVHTFGDAHIYENHVEQVKEQLQREPKPFPRLIISDEAKSLESFRPEMVTLEGYDPHPVLKAEMTVAGGFDEDQPGSFFGEGLLELLQVGLVHPAHPERAALGFFNSLLGYCLIVQGKVYRFNSKNDKTQIIV